MKRRTVLSLIVVGLSGCTNPDRTAGLSTSEKSLTSSMKADAKIVKFENLTPDEQDLLQKALPESYYIKCRYPGDGSPWWTLSRRKERQDFYLQYNNKYYGIWLHIGDELFMTTTSMEGSVDEECGIPFL